MISPYVVRSKRLQVYLVCSKCCCEMHGILYDFGYRFICPCCGETIIYTPDDINVIILKIKKVKEDRFSYLDKYDRYGRYKEDQI